MSECAGRDGCQASKSAIDVQDFEHVRIDDFSGAANALGLAAIHFSNGTDAIVRDSMATQGRLLDDIFSPRHRKDQKSLVSACERFGRLLSSEPPS